MVRKPYNDIKEFASAIATEARSHGEIYSTTAKVELSRSVGARQANDLIAQRRIISKNGLNFFDECGYDEPDNLEDGTLLRETISYLRNNLPADLTIEGDLERLAGTGITVKIRRANLT